MSKNVSKSTSTAHAYTPGLKVKREETVLKTRRLPIPGELLVNVGDAVEVDQSVARAYLPGAAELVKITAVLGLDPDDLPTVMRKKVGDSVKKGEVLANYKAFFGLIKRAVTSPLDGIIDSQSNLTGRVLVRGPKVPLEINAFIPGKVVDTIPREAVVIEINAALIQGIFGVGGETHGEIKMAVESNSEEIKPEYISDADKGKILIGGSTIGMEALKKAVTVGVKGIVVGGIKDIILFEFIGKEIGVAITGNEDIGLTLILTEGFGQLSMSERSFNLWKDFEGQKAAINGATQIRAGVQRPEVIIPHSPLKSAASDLDLSDGMAAGTPIRIIREPYFGDIGKVHGLPVELQRLESESMVRVVDIELPDGKIVTVPRANVEIVEE